MNIKNIKTYILSGILALSMSSCLDKYPEDSIRMDQAINTVDDMDKLVYGIYDSFKSSALYSGNLTILPDLQADFVYCVKGYSNDPALPIATPVPASRTMEISLPPSPKAMVSSMFKPR